MFFLHAFLFILFGISVIAAPVHTPASGKGILLKPSDCGFWQKEHEKEDVLRIDENHGKLTLELYKLKALAKGANAEPEHVFITHGNKDHLLLDPKENADLVVGNQWVRLPWKYIPTKYRESKEVLSGYDAHLSIEMEKDRALHMRIVDNPWKED